MLESIYNYFNLFLGEFGIVYEAQLKESKGEKNTSTLVAVKTLKSKMQLASI